ncbi:hypothetical protein OH77DRAFT_1428706 [Trametes cingulata]|nr:hypothetical protein OH77DRAFT_1428706 [Trametes cingulata]
MPAPESTHPFTYPSGDILFVSSDGVHFKLHKIILSLASEFFQDMFNLPQPSLESPRASVDDPALCPGPGSDGLPTVHVAESGAVLENLFRLCYPIANPRFQTIKDVRPILEAALKYQMSEAIELTTHKLLELADTAPVRVYAIACRLCMETIARAAARIVLDKQLQHTYVEELDEISAVDYHHLLSYCHSLGSTSLTFGDHATTEPDLQSDTHPVPSEAGSSGVQSLWDPPQVIPPTTTIPSYPGPPCALTKAGKSDVVIHTSDDMCVVVPTEIIRLFSPVLSGRLPDDLLPAPYVLPVTEPCHVLLTLLRICHPSSPLPMLTDLRQITDALRTAEKYQILKAKEFLQDTLWARVQELPSPSPDALAFYFIACQLRLPHVAARAARKTLGLEILEGVSSVHGAASATGGCLWRLWDYHRRCRATAHAMVNDLDWVAPEWKTKLHTLCLRSKAPSYRFPCWVKPYLAAMAKEPWPTGALAMDDRVLNMAVQLDDGSLNYKDMCSECESPTGMLMLASLSMYMHDSMDAKEKKVRLWWKEPDLPPRMIVAK